MKVKNASAYLVKWPFTLPVKHSLALNVATENLVVEIEDYQGRFGYGEGIPRQYVTGETISAAVKALKKDLLPPLLEREIDPALALDYFGELCPEFLADQTPAAACAVETALWDLAGQILGRPAVELIGGSVRNQFVYSGVIPLASPQQLPQLLEIVKSLGLKEIKFKVGTDSDMETASLIREFMGPQARLRVDANGAWTAPEAVEKIESLDRFGIEAVEQPVPKDRPEDLAYVRERVEPLILADESACTPSEVQGLIDLEAVDGFNLRLSKCGGPSRTGRLLKMARDHGLVSMLGCQVGELGVLSAAGRHFAAANEDLIFLEGSLTKLIMDRDIIDEDLTFGPGGLAGPLEGPGLGVNVLKKALEDSLLFKLR